jgi:outer membrane protein
MAGNIAVVQVGRLLDESRKGKVLSETLRTAADKWQKELDALQTKLREQREKLEGTGAQAGLEARYKIEREMRLTELDLTHLQSKARLDLESRRDQARARVLQELDPLLVALAAEKKFELVLTVPSQLVAFAAKDLDVTDELLRRYDASA